MSRINGNNGASAANATQSDSRSAATASMPLAAGSNSALIAQIAIRLQDSSDRSRDMRRTAQASQREATLDKIENQRDAAVAQFAGTIANSVGSIASAAVGGSNEAVGKGLEAGGSLGQGIGNYIAADQNAEASLDELRANTHRDAAQDHGADVQRLQAQMDRAMGAVDNLAQARNRAIDEAIG